MKKITVCNIDEEGRFGGPERRIVLVAEGLIGHEVDVLLLIPQIDSDKFETEITCRNIPYKKINYARLTLEFWKLLRYVIRFPLDVLLTMSALRESGNDLVHINGSYQFRSAIAAFLARKAIVWHVNDAKMHWAVKSVFLALAPKIADGFIFSSLAARDYYFPQGFNEQRIKAITIPPPVQPERFTGTRQKDSLINGKKTLSIVTVTGINPDKGVEYFIESAALIHASIPDVVFRVAAAIHSSQRKYFSTLQALVQEKGLSSLFQFVGFVDNIPQFLLDSDIFLYTSNTEAGPAAVWEAMAAGLPVVTTSVGAIPEYLEHGKHALIAPPRDAQRLSELTLQLIHDEQLREKLANAGRKQVFDMLSVDAATQKHIEIYSEVLKNA